MLRLCRIALRKYNTISIVVKSMLKIMESGRLDLDLVLSEPG